MTRVPTAVRLATDLKSQPGSLSGSFLSSPADALSHPGTSPLPVSDKPAEGGSLSNIPETPVATPNGSPERTPPPELEVSVPELPRRPSYLAKSMPSSPEQTRRYPLRQRVFLPPPNAFNLGVSPSDTDSGSVAVESIDSFGTLSPTESESAPPARTVLAPGQFRKPVGIPAHRDRSASANLPGPAAIPVIKNRVSSVGMSTSVQQGTLAELFRPEGPRRSSDDASPGLMEGDASRHANMILQSRKAKLQRWRPGSSGQGGPEESAVTPAIEAPRTGYFLPVTPHFRPQENNTEDIQSDDNFSSLGPAQHQRHGSDAASPDVVLRPSIDGSLLRPGPVSEVSTPWALESGNTSSVNGIEWVDWLDEYKKYKAAKLKAEQQTNGAEQNEEVLLDDIDHAPGGRDSPAAPIPQPLPSTEPLRRPVTPPRPERIPLRHAATSPIDTKASTRERPRQSSYSSNHSQHGKKRRNLAAKMEGWWTAVKSNFAPHPAQTRKPSFGAAVVRRPSRGESGRMHVKPLTGGRRSRPTSVIAPMVPDEGPAAKGKAKAAEKVTPPRMLRMSSSHGEIRSSASIAQPSPRQAAQPLLADSSVASGSTSQLNPDAFLSPAGPALTTTPGEMGLQEGPNVLGSPVKSASSLEARRKQPALSLKLENKPFVPPAQRRMTSQMSNHTSDTGETSGSSGASRPIRSTLPPRSGSQSFKPGPGLTPGPSRWDQTPSPLYSFGTPQDGVKDAMQTDSDFTMASVKRHVKHRLTAAKDTCDRELRQVISSITAYVEFQIQQGVAMPKMATDDQSGVSDSETAPVLKRAARSRTTSVSLAARPVDAAALRNAQTSGVDSPQRRLSSRPTNRPSDIKATSLGRGLPSVVDHSSASSRSTSRSRSPMPGARLLPGDDAGVRMPAPDLLSGLQEIIAVSTDVLETNVSAMITRPGDCKSMVHRVQQIGRLWDEKKDLPGRGWYVQVLLAVAALCRVVEWWEAEKGFWDFDEDSDEDEPLAFVMRPSREEEDFAIGGEQRQAGSLPEPPTARPVSVVTSKTPLESPALQARAPEAQDLHLQAEHAKSVNIVIELSLGGEIIEWVNPAWEEVVGSDISSAIGTPISAWLAPADVSVLSDASRRLEGDDTHTAQARFRLLHVADISDDDSDREPGPAFIEFEGIGMLMRDRDSGVPSHTMWVIKPMPPSEVAEGPQAEVDPLSLISPGVGAPGFTFDKAVHSQELLCRICERQVPAWFFEKHNETCNEVHRLEADIAATNEKVADMRKAVLELKKSLGADDQRETIKYQGMPLINEVASTANTVPQAGALLLAVRKIQHALLDEAIDVLAAALRISTPSMREGAVDQPIQYQMLLSPTSEDKLTLISRWVKPDTDDAAFALLFRNVDDIIREKQTTVNRMRNTIMYSERVRQEWESKVEKWMQQAEDGSGSSGESQSGEEAEATPAADETEAPEATRSNSDPQPTTSGDGAAEAAALTAELKPPAILARHQTSPAAVTLPTSTSHHRGGSGDQGGSSSDSPVTLSPSVSLRKGKHSRHGSLARLTMQGGAMSPRLPSVAPMSKTTSTSIKDFDIIKPISRGAFGSVYLAKKRTTGDYFAIKALKKSDMIAKNQITNVKAERTILMSQSSSPYVAKLFFSFQNRDYLYLVMEYLNGGDCAALVKTLGGLPEDWARNYIAEVILGLEYLHDRGVVHRDLKPDNLLIDAKGHLKLTDFGLSKIGLLNRQVGGPRPAVLRGTDLRRFNDDQSPNAPSLFSGASPIQTPDLLGPAASSYFGGHLTDAGSADESSGSELPRPKASVGGGGGSRSISSSAPRRSKEPARFVGTPDYLCPESILGFGADDETVDWWALGVVLYEFLYGFPPFHDETPEKVFDNIVSRRINWYEDEMELSPEARDLMERLMCTDPKARLGANGASEIKQHAFFAGLDWDNICDAEASFVPSVTDPESTDYFDARGATSAVFLDDEAEDDHSPRDSKASLTISPQDRALKTLRQQIREDSASPTGSGDDFGTFDYRNLPVLKQANDDTIKRFRSESFAPGSPGALLKDRRLDQVTRRRARNRGSLSEIPPSPSGSTSSSASTPSRGSALPLTPGLGPTLQPRRVSDQHAQLVKVAENMDAETLRRNSAPESLESPTSSSALRADAAETPDQGPVTGTPPRSIQAPQTLVPRKDEEGQQARGQSRPCDVLIAEDNPISQKILETLLTRMGCRCVCVADGAEALAASLSEIREPHARPCFQFPLITYSRFADFDLIFLDLVIPNISGEEVARMIRSTNNANVSTPIIAATSYEHKQFESTFLRGPTAIFSAILIKPIGKKDLVECLARLGFALGPPPGTNRSSQSNSALNLAQQATTILEPPPGPRTPGQVRAEGYLQIPVRPIEASEVA